MDDRRPFIFGRRARKEPLHRINQWIKAPQLRVVGEGIVQGVYSREDAIRMAEQTGLDLVEIAPSANPPVCKIIDYNKFLYDQKKRQKEIKSKSQKVIVKEVRFGPHTDEHDFNFKVKHSLNFLQDGAKVKAFVMFRGREMQFKEQGAAILSRLTKAVEDYGIVEMFPRMEGNRMIMILIPKRKK